MRLLAAVFGLTAVVAAFLPFSLAPVMAVLLAVAAAAVVQPSSLIEAWRLRTLAVLVSVGVGTALAVASVSGPGRGMVVGAAVLLRFLALVLLATLASRTVDADRVVTLAQRLGLERLALVLGLALNTVQHLVEAVKQSWIALAFRSAEHHVPPRRFPLLIETLIAHTARLAEEAAVAASIRGHRALVRQPRSSVVLPFLVVVTGSPGAGKTPVVEAAARALNDAGILTAGFVQHAIRQSGDKIGFDVQDVATGASSPFARKVGRGMGEHGTRFVFLAEGFARGHSSLLRLRRPRVLVADELGPVELRGEGHMTALRRAIPRLGSGVLLCSVRRHLIPTVLSSIPARSHVIVDVTEHEDPVSAVFGAVNAALADP